MTKAPLPASHPSPRRAAAAEGAPDGGGQGSGSISLRIESQTRQLIDEAAAVLGKTRTEFMIDSARTRAIDVLLDQRLFSLDDNQYGTFAEALDNPPPPGPKLRALLNRTPAWKT